MLYASSTVALLNHDMHLTLFFIARLVRMEFFEKIFSEIDDIGNAFKMLINNQRCNYFLTPIYDQDLHLKVAEKILRNFHAALDGRVLGKSFYKKPIAKRLFSISFPEHIHSNIHYHTYCRVEPSLMRVFPKYCEQAWKDVCPKGKISIALRTDDHLDKSANYIKKELFNLLNYENFKLSTEFINPRIKSDIKHS